MALEIILACSIALNVYFYAQVQTPTPTAGETAFNRQFGTPVVVSPDLTFSPPIPMYKAMTIALNSDGWNASSLQNMTITVSLEYMEFTNTSDSSGFQMLKEVTLPQPSYADDQVNATTTFRYIWDITINRSSQGFIPPWLYYVDAQTGDIIPHGILY